MFAVAASGYVLKKGIEAGNKSKYQLLLHCVLIITRYHLNSHLAITRTSNERDLW